LKTGLKSGVWGLITVRALLKKQLAEPVGNRAFLTKAWLAFAAVLALLAVFMIRASGASAQDYGPVFASFLGIAIVSFLTINACAQIFSIFTPGPWKLEIRAGWTLCVMLLPGITLPLFELFKQLILPARGFPLDPALARIDRFFFFGHDAWELTHALFGTVGMTMLFDRSYSVWLFFMFLFPILVVMSINDIRMRVRLLANWLAAWVMIAGVAAWVFGSAGPCYYDAMIAPDAGFASLNASLAQIQAAARAGGNSITALDFQALLIEVSKQGKLTAAGGISAMPSMHVAMAVLFAIGGFARTRWLGWVMTGYALLIWVASVHLGWHYAVDGVAGAAMMLGLWRLSGKFIRPLSPTA
jgi:hypothetical protein